MPASHTTTTEPATNDLPEKQRQPQTFSDALHKAADEAENRELAAKAQLPELDDVDARGELRKAL